MEKSVVNRKQLKHDVKISFTQDKPVTDIVASSKTRKYPESNKAVESSSHHKWSEAGRQQLGRLCNRPAGLAAPSNTSSFLVDVHAI